MPCTIAQQIKNQKIESSFKDTWEFLKENGRQVGAKLNYKIQIDGQSYTVKDIDDKWRVSISLAPKATPFTGIAKTGEESVL